MRPDPFAEPILHVDMDAFFVEVERRREPRLRGIPVLVGGTGPRGVVASASYEARRRGARSAMPMAHARRLCPHAALVPPDHARYRAVSAEVFRLLRSITPHVEGLSLDEAFLDVSGLRLHYDSAVPIGEDIRRRLQTELGLPASVGVASSKLLAKLASSAAKPDGLLHVPREREREFLDPLPVRALWGVGEATHATLERLGVTTIGELAEVPPATLRRHLGEVLGASLGRLAAGRDDRPVLPEGAPKSISVEHTYEQDLEGAEVLHAELLRHCDRLAGRLRRARVAGRTLTVKIRFDDFTTVTRRATLPGVTDVARDLYREARSLLERIPFGGRRVRLVGVGLSGLAGAGAPRQLAVDRPGKWDDLAAAVERIRERFGDEAVVPAKLAPPGATSR